MSELTTMHFKLKTFNDNRERALRKERSAKAKAAYLRQREQELVAASLGLYGSMPLAPEDPHLEPVE